MFEDDEAFEGEIDEKEIVVDEMGAAMLHSQKRAEEAHREAGCYGKCQLHSLFEKSINPFVFTVSKTAFFCNKDISFRPRE